MNDQPTAAVPERYRGVWSRTLLQTPEARDERSFVRWLQTAHRHADLRIPDEARDAVRQQGFYGLTTVDVVDGGEQCGWHRQVDFQPPGRTPDAGWMVFDGPDRVIETGVHGNYLEVWDRLPGSTGLSAVLQAGDTRLLLAGCYAMRVRPRAAGWPTGTAPGTTLAEVLQRHPEERPRLLDFEISFGRLEGGRLCITHSTLAALEGRDEACRIERCADGQALVHGDGAAALWSVLEWV